QNNEDGFSYGIKVRQNWGIAQLLLKISPGCVSIAASFYSALCLPTRRGAYLPVGVTLKSRNATIFSNNESASQKACWSLIVADRRHNRITSLFDPIANVISVKRGLL